MLEGYGIQFISDCFFNCIPTFTLNSYTCVELITINYFANMHPCKAPLVWILCYMFSSLLQMFVLTHFKG